MSQLGFDGMPVAVPVEVLSVGARRTLAHKRAIAAGKHPANGLPIDTEHKCGDCGHLWRVPHNSRVYLKCMMHRLGVSRSDASDMRASWPACPYWVENEG